MSHTIDSSPMQQRLHALRERMAAAALRAGRKPEDVSLLAVSKTFSAADVRDAHALGLVRFAENKAQELRAKAPALQDLPLEWVLIGHLQTNKAKDVARIAHEIQSLDRWDLAQALNKRLEQEGRQMRALVQVKTSQEESKFGLPADQLQAFVDRVHNECPALQLQGLMTMAENSPDPAIVRHCFAQLAQLRTQLLQAGFAHMTRLSMGMSGDFEIAIEEGATDIRVGSALFGARDYA